jgi:asparagine synthase (glutamine-hydrolysing)
MCAINGITTHNPEIVQSMNDRTKHRGPDGSQVWTDNFVTLGHNRLAIIDLNERSLQPMVGGRGRYVIVFNGEIYNYRELRESLSDGYTFVTESDTEVLLAAYERWGRDVFVHLRGIFAFAIWDRNDKTLILARDHMGVKPIYYRVQGNILMFSSELTGLLESKDRINTQELAQYIGLQYVPSPRSLIYDINKVSPGHYIWYTAGKIEDVTYYDPVRSFGIPEVPTKLQHTKQTLISAIDKAVERQLVSDRPIGIFLSGGIDSSIVLHHATQHINHMKTFSVDFEMVAGAESESKKFNADAQLAERTAHQYGAQHTTFRISLKDIRENFEKILMAVDEPVANPTVISQYILSQRVREHGVVVALGGDGGDELFGGYTRHRMALAAYLFQKIPSFIRGGITTIYPHALKLNTQFPVELHYLLMADKIAPQYPIFTRAFDMRSFVKDRLQKAYARTDAATHPVDTFMKIDRETWLPDESLARSDRTSMAHGLELRVPLLDIDLVTVADSFSVSEKLTPRTGKKILRGTYRHLLPQYVLTQPKRGWISPGAKWLRDPVIQRIAFEILSEKYYDGLSIVDWSTVQKMLKDHIDHKGYFLYPVWNLIALQVWARTHNIIST